MTSRKKPSVAFRAAVGLVVVLPVLYVAGYSFAVGRIKSHIGGTTAARPIYSVPFASDRQDLWRTFFGSAHAVDRRIRPNFWPKDRYGRLHSDQHCDPHTLTHVAIPGAPQPLFAALLRADR